jgi:predicted nucleic acid-binding protein
MQMPDVNVLVYAHREESRDHERYAVWLVNLANGGGAVCNI